ncbi:hypothetical protein LZG72_22755 [Dyadobacter sp. CY323]|nr:hypothetical protein [Dyadobacter sp. CY323]
MKDWDPQPSMITFNVYSQDNDAFREIRIYGKELKNGTITPFDSTIFNAINWNGTEETFPKGRGYGLAFFADSLIEIQNGSFEAVAVRKDFSLVRTDFGRITAGKTHEDFRIVLTTNGILVEEI